MRKVFGEGKYLDGGPENPRILSARLSGAKFSVVKGKLHIESKST